MLFLHYVMSKMLLPLTICSYLSVIWTFLYSLFRLLLEISHSFSSSWAFSSVHSLNVDLWSLPFFLLFIISFSLFLCLFFPLQPSAQPVQFAAVSCPPPLLPGAFTQQYTMVLALLYPQAVFPWSLLFVSLHVLNGSRHDKRDLLK